MPPPQPSQIAMSQHTSHAPTSQPTMPSSFGGGRELPALSTINKPSGSMSILSMLGDNVEKPQKEGPSPVHTTVSATDSQRSVGGVRPPTPPYSVRANGHGSEKTSSPSEYRAYSNSTRSFRAYSGVENRPPSSKSARSPDDPRSRPMSAIHRHHHSLSPTSEPPFRQIPTGDVPAVQGAQMSRDAINGSGFRNSPHMNGDNVNSSGFSPVQVTPQLSAQGPLDQRQKPSLYEDRDQSHQRSNEITRQSLDAQHHTEIMHERQPNGMTEPSSNERPRVSNYPFLSRANSKTSQPRTQASQTNDTVRTSRRDLDSSLPSPSIKSQHSPELLRRLREQNHTFDADSQTSDGSPTRLRSQLLNDGLRSTSFRRAASTSRMSIDRPHEGGDHPMMRTESNPLHRTSLGLLLDNNRRGRLSPLPQAVQGAQGRTSGPGSDKPGFGRMFSGLGISARSAGQTGSGASTPFHPPSPKPENDLARKTSLTSRQDLIEISKSRNGSRNGKRMRSLREDGVEPAQDDQDPSASRAAKRGRMHHHHHVV